MNLFDFEDYLDDIILSRGWEYYQDNCIRSITRKGKSTYIATVNGTRNYTVTIELDADQNILNLDCDCPYDLGPYCKHQAAVLYALNEIAIENLDDPAAGTLDHFPASDCPKQNQVWSAQETDSDRFRSMISAQPQEKLVQFLVNLALEYDEIGRLIELEFGTVDLDDEIRSCSSLIKSFTRQYSDRHGFISYREAFGATEGARMVLERADQAAEAGDYRRSLELYLCILHEMVPLLQHADDSDGYIGETIDQAISGLDSLSSHHLPAPIAEQYFKKLLKESDKKMYAGWSDWQLSLLTAIANLTTTAKQRQQFEKHLASFINKTDENYSHSRYLAERIAMIHYQLILKHDGEEKAADYITQNLSYPLFREMAIEQSLSRKDYDRVEELARAGENHDQGWPGLVHKWKEFRYEAYRRSGQLEQERQLALEFILAGHSEYYKPLKSTYSPSEWASVYPGIIEMLEKQKSGSPTYTTILIEERELEKLLQFVKKDPSYIIQFYKHLLPVYKDEVYAIFTQHILATAQKASNRSHYRNICSDIKLMAKSGGSSEARQLISQLVATYPRRPAFREELAKIKL